MTSWTSRVNDRSLELLIVLARWGGLLVALAAVVLLLTCIWTGDGRYAATALCLAGLATGCGWWGWWHMGNIEWSRPLYDGARWGDLHCNVQVDPKTGRHIGPHMDGLRDSEGAQTWS